MKERGALLLGLFALALVLVSGRSALGQERTGRIDGTIYDDEGMPLAGARVTVSSLTQIGGPRTAVTGEDGSFRFLGLIPGEFSVVVGRTGFIGAVRKGIRVNVGKTLTLDILLDRDRRAGREIEEPERPEEPGAAKRPRAARRPPAKRTETYVVSTARPMVDVTKAVTGESLSDEYVEHVPILGRSYQGVAGMTRGVTQKRDPKGSGQGNPTSAGGAYFQNTYTVDGMDTTDPVTHTFSTNFNFDAMADVEIKTGGTGPEHSDTPGGVVNMVTKSGSNTFELDSSVYYQDDALTIKQLDEEGTTFRNLDVNINVGGPILRDRLWYYTSFELNQSTNTLPPDPNRVLPNHPSREYLGIKWLGKLTAQLSQRHKLVWWAQASPGSIANAEQTLYHEPDAEYHQNQYNVLTTAAWEWLASDKLYVKTQIGWGWNRLDIYPESGIYDVSRIFDVGSGVYRRNYYRAVLDDRMRFSVHADATRFFDNAFGDHEVKGGLRYKHIYNPTEETYTGNEELNYQFGRPYARKRYFLEFDETSACDPTSNKYDASKCLQGTLETSVSGNQLIAFLQDTWKLPRYKRLRLIPGAAFHFGETINPEGQTITEFVTATGHLNFAWDLFGDGKTVIRGGYNQYVDMGFLGLARFIGKDQIEHTCYWDEAAQSYSSQCQVGAKTRTVGVPLPTFDDKGKVTEKYNPDALTVPRVHELTLGAEREWLAGFSTGLDFQLRLYTNQWEDLETNVIWDETGDSARGYRSGKSEYIYDLETPEEAYRRYIGLSIFARRFIGNWQVMAAYTYSHFEGTVSEGYATVFLDRPRQVQFFDGYMPDDRRHVIKLNGFYTWRKQLTLGATVWVGTGTPYDKLYYNSYFRDYEDRRAVRGMDPKDLSTPEDDEELRTPTRLVFDIKVTYKLADLTEWLLRERINLELIGEIFNLFNLRTATRYEERNLLPGASTQWGDIIDTQDPFRVRFGMRYRY